jgi:ribonuclease HI
MSEIYYLATDGACKMGRVRKSGSGIVIYKDTAHVWKFAFANNKRAILGVTITNTEPLEPGHYEIKLHNIDGDIYNYNFVPVNNTSNANIDNNANIVLSIKYGGEDYDLTNNRAEYIAYILGNLILCSQFCEQKNISAPNYTLVADSKLLLNTLEFWLPKWVKTQQHLKQKNPDLLNLFLSLGNFPNKYVHINSHLKPHEYKALTQEQKFYSDLNTIADKLTNDAAFF